MYIPGTEHRERYEQMRRDVDELQTSYYFQTDTDATNVFAGCIDFIASDYEKVGPFTHSFITERGYLKNELYGIPLIKEFEIDMRDRNSAYVAFVANSQRMGIPLKTSVLDSPSPFAAAISHSNIRVLMVQAAISADKRTRVVHTSLVEITDLVAYYDSPPNHRFIMATHDVSVPEGSILLMKGDYIRPKKDLVSVLGRMESIYNQNVIGDIDDDALKYHLFNEFMD